MQWYVQVDMGTIQHTVLLPQPQRLLLDFCHRVRCASVVLAQRQHDSVHVDAAAVAILQQAAQSLQVEAAVRIRGSQGGVEAIDFVEGRGPVP